MKLLGVVMLLLFLASGCAGGVLFEKHSDNGSVNRLRLEGAESWGEYDTTPRYRSQKPKDQDGYGIVMKNEATF